MCGKLAVYLRMCGYDTAYALDRDVEADAAICAWSDEEGRTVLTRDRQLAASSDGLLLTERSVEGQLRELRDAGLELTLDGAPTYCGTCNGPVERGGPDASTPEYAPDAGETDVWRCRHCGQYFWKGSHWARVEETVRGL